MAKVTILWTVLPWGRVPDGQRLAGNWRVSVVVSPRLTPEAPDEQLVKAFEEFINWPKAVTDAKFSLRIGSQETALIPLAAPDPDLWDRIIPETTPVAGFVFKDMSKVNLRSFALRNVLRCLRRNYGALAVQSADDHPTLLPWRNADPGLKGFLTELGTRTQTINLGDRQVEFALPGFSRFFDDGFEKRIDGTVFGGRGLYTMPVEDAEVRSEGELPEDPVSTQIVGTVARRTLPSDWYNPRPGGPGTPLLPNPDAAFMDNFSSAQEYDFYQANRFYRREPYTEAETKVRRPDFENIPAPPKAPDYDFHRIAASFSNYPALQRELGLVLDFAIEDSKIIDARIAAGNGTARGQMRLEIRWGHDHDPAWDTRPVTAWVADKERFNTRPRSSDQTRGLLRLERCDDAMGLKHDKPGLFDIYQVDPDGSALKTVNFTLSAQNLVAKSLSFKQQDGEVTYTTGDRQPVAALRSGGIGISRHGMATEIAKDAASAAVKNQKIEGGNGHRVVLFAEDVHKGYRIDVAPVDDEIQPGKWHSLMQRVGDYRLIETNAIISLPADEGHVSGASTTAGASAGANPDDHYLHESMFRWAGWSLAAPRPGLTLRSGEVDGTKLQSETPAAITDTADNGNGVAVGFKALKGSLPKLRFGQLYRFRARVVDIAGNSLALDDPTLKELEQASEAVGYWRFEPVDPPALVNRARLSEGESLERMVIRSDGGLDASAYLASETFTDAIALPESRDFEYGKQNERHVVPPKSSQLQCETHGLFDPFFAGHAAIKQGYEIAAREEGTLYDSPPGAIVELVTPKSLDDIATTQTVPPQLPSPENPEGDRIAGGQYVVHREAKLVTPYLPDGAAAGVAIRAMPGHILPGVAAEMDLGADCVVRKAPNGELVLMVSYTEDWPDTTGFRIILAERLQTVTPIPCAESFVDAGLPVWDSTERTLTFFVEKGRIVRLRYASFAHPALIKTFGIPQWTNTAAARDAVMKSAVFGTNWMITPYRALTLVHATQAPICDPELINLSSSRSRGAQTVQLNCRIVRLHGPSTGKFEIEAEWHEWSDDPAKEKPERIHHRGQLAEVPLAENHRNEFTLDAPINAQIIDPKRKPARGDVHDFGDTRFRLVKYRARATTRFREYLPPSIFAKADLVTKLGSVAKGPGIALPDETDAGAPVLTSATGSTDQSIILASDAPANPRVLYVMPTFQWIHSGTPQQRTSTRLGNGLRVWLDRPWFSSGDGELLGVVVSQEEFAHIPKPFQGLVTQWGLDPLWDTAPPKLNVRAEDFPARIVSESVKLQEQPAGSSVLVVGHRVHWDDNRRLWYADILLEPGATYMPFVRFALVRHQPHAIPGAKVSQVVQAEFSQVLPRRRAEFARNGNVVSLAVKGPVPSAGPMKFPVDSEFTDISFIHGPHETGRNRIELVLQTRDPAIDSDLAWSDHSILASAIVGGSPSGTPFPIEIDFGGLFAERAVPAATGRDAETRAGTAVRFAAMSERLEASESIPPVLLPFPVEKPFWSVNATLPPNLGKNARLMLREFERYYTDRVRPERVGGVTRQRRIVEERLVYAAEFEL